MSVGLHFRCWSLINSNQCSKTATEAGEQQTKFVFIGLKSGSRPVLRAVFLCKESCGSSPSRVPSTPDGSPGRCRSPAGWARRARAPSRAVSGSAARCRPAQERALPPGPGQPPGGPGAPSGTPHSPGGLPGAGAGRGAAPGPGRLLALRYPTAPCAPGPRCPAASRLPPSGLSLGHPRCLFIGEAPPEPRAARTGQRRRRAGGAGAAAPSAWEERAAAGAERRRGEGRI